MQRIELAERPDWRRIAARDGFQFHTLGGDPYWVESAAYRFSLRQVEQDIEDVSAELYAMCLEFVERAVADERILRDLQIPEFAWPIIADSWARHEGGVYGRMDLSYDGSGPAKLLEFNADTPTSVYEAAYFQWGWLEGMLQRGLLPADADQFNSIQEQLIDAFASLPIAGGHLHLASCKDSEEDRATVQYLQDCAIQAGWRTDFVYMEDIGVDRNGQFIDGQDRAIHWLFKLYPWEWLLVEPYARYLQDCDTNFIEPPWKALLSNKGMLVYLWRLFPGHPNLLATYFEQDPHIGRMRSYAKKPLFAREGANVALFERGQKLAAQGGAYGDEGYVRQELALLPRFDDFYPVIGCWLVNGQACGMGIREDHSRITADDARFLPHFIAD